MTARKIALNDRDKQWQPTWLSQDSFAPGCMPSWLTLSCHIKAYNRHPYSVLRTHLCGAPSTVTMLSTNSSWSPEWVCWHHIQDGNSLMDLEVYIREAFTGKMPFIKYIKCTYNLNDRVSKKIKKIHMYVWASTEHVFTGWTSHVPRHM